jgi:hypoxanthine-guanine phosphoribosyltransferase
MVWLLAENYASTEIKEQYHGEMPVMTAILRSSIFHTAQLLDN